MKTLTLLCVLLVSVDSLGQNDLEVSTADFVKIKNDHRAEAIYFYESNWKVYRDRAVARSFIKGYRLLKVQEQSKAEFDIICITEYSSADQLKLSEPRFQQIIKDTRPDGPRLLNEIKPDDFRQVMFSTTTETLFSCANKTSCTP
jgi:hypothetical protein